MTQQDTKYKTHWHSFWFGFMSALSIVLFLLLTGTITEHVSFKKLPKKDTTIKKSTKSKSLPLSSESFKQFIQENNIDRKKFDTCLNNKKHEADVQDDINSGKEANVKGTPHSFVLIDNAIYEIPGAYSEKGMREFFNDLLANKNPRAKDISKKIKLKPVDSNDWIRGNSNARITVIEYSDLDCPFCKQFHKSVMNLVKDYPKDVRWIFRHMPIDRLHPDARRKAEASECIGEIGGVDTFWKYIDTVLGQ